MFLRQLFDGPTWTYTYLIADTQTGDAALIDPVLEQVDRDLALIEELGFTLRYALDTHVHADHVTASGVLRERTACQTVGGVGGAECADVKAKDGEQLQLGALTIKVLATPGHTDDSVSFLVGAHVFTGDALFVRGTGRTDFQNGDAGTLYDSITQRLFPLGDEVTVWPGHDYKGHTCSTIGEERRFNPRLAGKTREQFVQLMADLKLPRPRLIDQAVPANRACGLTSQDGSTVQQQQQPQATAAPPPEAAQLWERAHTTGAGYREVGPEALRDAAAARVIDVREPDEFDGELGHIPASELVPLAQLQGASKDWERQQLLVMVCRSGNRSGKAAAALVEQGFPWVVNLRGGMIAYNDAGLTVERKGA